MKKFDVKIRKMEKSDIPSIGKVIQRVLNKHDSEKAKKDMVDQHKKLYVDGENFVAEVNKKLIGTIGFWRLEHHPKKVAWLDWFAVDRGYQNRGIGSMLLSHLIHTLYKRNYEILCCEKSSMDVSSKFFYDKHQFIEFGRLKKYWEDDGDLILLVKHL